MKEDKKEKVIGQNTVKIIIISVNVLIMLAICITILIKFYG